MRQKKKLAKTLLLSMLVLSTMIQPASASQNEDTSNDPRDVEKPVIEQPIHNNVSLFDFVYNEDLDFTQQQLGVDVGSSAAFKTVPEALAAVAGYTGELTLNITDNLVDTSVSINVPRTLKSITIQSSDLTTKRELGNTRFIYANSIPITMIAIKGKVGNSLNVIGSQEEMNPAYPNAEIHIKNCDLYAVYGTDSARGTVKQNVYIDVSGSTLTNLMGVSSLGGDTSDKVNVNNITMDVRDTTSKFIIGAGVHIEGSTDMTVNNVTMNLERINATYIEGLGRSVRTNAQSTFRSNNISLNLKQSNIERRISAIGIFDRGDRVYANDINVNLENVEGSTAVFDAYGVYSHFQASAQTPYLSDVNSIHANVTQSKFKQVNGTGGIYQYDDFDTTAQMGYRVTNGVTLDINNSQIASLVGGTYTGHKTTDTSLYANPNQNVLINVNGSQLGDVYVGDRNNNFAGQTYPNNKVQELQMHNSTAVNLTTAEGTTGINANSKLELYDSTVTGKLEGQGVTSADVISSLYLNNGQTVKSFGYFSHLYLSDLVTTTNWLSSDVDATQASQVNLNEPAKWKELDVVIAVTTPTSRAIMPTVYYQGWITDEVFPYTLDQKENGNGTDWYLRKFKIYNVIFETNGGTLVPSQKVLEGKLATEPAVPVKEGYVFNGWMIDMFANTQWNFASNKVMQDVTLYAKWTPVNAPDTPTDNNAPTTGITSPIVKLGFAIAVSGGVMHWLKKKHKA